MRYCFFVVSLGVLDELGLELDGLVALEPLLLDGDDEELGELELAPEELGLELMDPELEPVADDGELVLDGLFEAPVLEPGPLLQPYRPPKATAMGRITTADFFSILIGAPLGTMKDVTGNVPVKAINGPRGPGSTRKDR